MSAQISRSIYGVSYIPFKPEEGKDKIRMPFAKAAVIDSVIKAIPDKIGSQILKKIGKEMEKRRVPEEKRNHFRKIRDYFTNRDYAELVSLSAKMDVETIKEFATKYMDEAEHELNKALNTLKATAMKLEKEPEEDSEDIRNEIHELHEDVKAIKAFMLRGHAEKEFKGVAKIAEEERLLREEVKHPVLSRAPVELRALKRMMKEKRDEAELLISFLPAKKFPFHVSDMVMTSFNLKKDQINKSVKQIEEGIYAGVLFLERMDFTPVELVKGELVYTLPLVPGEKTTVSHKEWVKSVEEFEKELATLTEEEREEAKTERTELAEATTKDEKTEHKFDTGLKVKGGWGAWSIELSAGYSYDNLKTKHSEFSSKRNREITHRAASRSREEHKITFKISREAGREDEQVRVIENKSDKPVRWDFYRMMRKWRIDLYRLGERLTFDIVVPEPGNYLLRKYLKLLEIQEKIDRGDPFNLSPEDISTDPYDENYYLKLAGEYGVSLPDPPTSKILTFEDMVQPQEGKAISGYRYVAIRLPEGYWIPVQGEDNDLRIWVIFPPKKDDWHGGNKDRNVSSQYWAHDVHGTSMIALYELNEDIIVNNFKNDTNFRSYDWVWRYVFKEKATAPATISLAVYAAPTPLREAQWRMECFEKIREAARTKWLQELERLENQRDRLIAELTGKDALKLRQIEKEEIMKTVLRWLLGPDFEFFPEEWINESASSIEELEDLPYYKGGKTETEKLMKMDEETRKRMLKYLKMVRFIQQAIEWENVNWILYPYFWTTPVRWDFKQSLEHPDFYHRAFLRAGCARVVLTVRPGFEEAFAKFIESGKIDGEIDKDHPYLTLAQEIKASSKTTYKYTPNPNRGDYVFCWDDVLEGDEGRLKEHLKNIGGVILKDLITDWKNLIETSYWTETVNRVVDAAKIEKSENTITVTLSYAQNKLILNFELDPKSGVIRVIKVLRNRRDILPLRYYSSEEKEGDATKRYVFFVPGEHIDTWYEYTPTGALHVEEGNLDLSTW